MKTPTDPGCPSAARIPGVDKLVKTIKSIFSDHTRSHGN